MCATLRLTRTCLFLSQTGFDYVNNVVFTVDLTFAVLGYALPLSCLHGAHFKSADGSAFGVVVAMLCYAPIFDMVTGRYTRCRLNHAHVIFASPFFCRHHF